MNDLPIARFTDEDGDDNALPAEFATATMGHVLAAQGRVDEARAVFAAVLARDPADVSAREGQRALGVAAVAEVVTEAPAPQAHVRALGMSPTELLAHWTVDDGATAHLGAAAAGAPLALLVTSLRVGPAGVLTAHQSILLDGPTGERVVRGLDPASTHLVALAVRLGDRLVPFARAAAATTPTDAPQPFAVALPARPAPAAPTVPAAPAAPSVTADEAPAAPSVMSVESAHARWAAGLASS
ncbi:MAG: tetratricopeptide repeat protein [Polyangiales bacterium]